MPSTEPSADATQMPRRIVARAANLGLCLAVGACVGAGAGALQAAGMSLLVLQSMAIGAMGSVMLIGAAATMGTQKPRWPAAIAMAVVAVVVQHLWLYTAVIAGRQKAAASQPAVELFRPGWSKQPFLAYMQSEATLQTIGVWTLDACLLALAAVVMVEWGASRRPT